MSFPFGGSSSPGFDRLPGQINEPDMRRESLLVYGVGGVVGALADIAASGVSRFALVDPDWVEEHNVGTQRFSRYDVGKSKVDAARSMITAANGAAEVITYRKRHDALDEREHDYLWRSASQVWIMTDDAIVHVWANKMAIRYGRDTLFAGVYPKSNGFEVVGTLAGSYTGKTNADGKPVAMPSCYRCAMHERVSRYENGRKRPASVSSSRIVSNRVNDTILHIAVGLMHARNNSKLAIARYGEEFMRNPLRLGLIDLDWQSAPDQAFGHLDAENRFCAVRSAVVQRPAGFTCEDCGKVY